MFCHVIICNVHAHSFISCLSVTSFNLTQSVPMLADNEQEQPNILQKKLILHLEEIEQTGLEIMT